MFSLFSMYIVLYYIISFLALFILYLVMSFYFRIMRIFHFVGYFNMFVLWILHFVMPLHLHVLRVWSTLICYLCPVFIACAKVITSRRSIVMFCGKFIMWLRGFLNRCDFSTNTGDMVTCHFSRAKNGEHLWCI
jgi:hypothetical protein